MSDFWIGRDCPSCKRRTVTTTDSHWDVCPECGVIFINHNHVVKGECEHFNVGYNSVWRVKEKICSPSNFDPEEPYITEDDECSECGETIVADGV